jgi:catechol 2,3-dioxygenase-like lactoylglutathione lyase family enzyme
MLDHVSIGVTDLARSRRFYDAVLLPLGLVRTLDFEGRGSDFGAMAGQLGVVFTITRVTGSARATARPIVSSTQRRFRPHLAGHGARERWARPS